MKGINDPRYDENSFGRLSVKEIKEICRLHDTGIYGVCGIAKKLGHTTYTVQKYLRLNGRYE